MLLECLRENREVLTVPGKQPHEPEEAAGIGLGATGPRGRGPSSGLFIVCVLALQRQAGAGTPSQADVWVSMQQQDS